MKSNSVMNSSQLKEYETMTVRNRDNFMEKRYSFSNLWMDDTLIWGSKGFDRVLKVIISSER